MLGDVQGAGCPCFCAAKGSFDQDCRLRQQSQSDALDFYLRKAGDRQHHNVARSHLSGSIRRVSSTAQGGPPEIGVFRFAELFHGLCECWRTSQIQNLHLFQSRCILHYLARDLSKVVGGDRMLRRHSHCPIGQLQCKRVTHPPEIIPIIIVVALNSHNGSNVDCFGPVPLDGFPVA